MVEDQGSDALDTGTWYGADGDRLRDRDGAAEAEVETETQERAAREWGDEATTLETAADIVSSYGYLRLGGELRELAGEVRGNVNASQRYLDARLRTRRRYS